MSKHFDLETFTFNGIALRPVTLGGGLWFPMIDLCHLLGGNPDNFSAN